MFGNNKLYSFITYLTLLVAFLLATFLSTACNTATPLPPLGQAGQPTLVLVYTDG